MSSGNKYIDSTRVVYWDDLSGNLTVPGTLYTGGGGGDRSGQTTFGSNVYTLSNFYSQTEAESKLTDPTLITNWSSNATVAIFYGVAASADGKYQIAVINFGGIYLSINYGESFLPIAGMIGNWERVSISAVGKYMAVVAKTDGIQKERGLYISSNYGGTWTQVIEDTLLGVSVSATGKYIVAAGTNTRIYVSNNYGETFSQVESARAWTDIAVNETGQYMVAVGSNINVFVSTDYGVTWSAKGVARNYNGCCLDSTGQLILATTIFGYIYMSYDGGFSFSQVAGTGAEYFWNISCTANGQNAIATDREGRVYISKTRGQTWTQPFTMAGDLGQHFVAFSRDGTYIVMSGVNCPIYSVPVPTYLRTTIAGPDFHTSSITSDSAISFGNLAIFNSNIVVPVDSNAAITNNFVHFDTTTNKLVFNQTGGGGGGGGGSLPLVSTNVIYIAGSQGGTINVEKSSFGWQYSYDLVNWTYLPNGFFGTVPGSRVGGPHILRYFNGIYMAGGNKDGLGTMLLISCDGINWEKITVPFAGTTDDGIYDIVYNNGIYHAIGNGGYGGFIYYSYDARNWSRAISNTGYFWPAPYGSLAVGYSIAYSNGRWVAVGLGETQNSSIYYSTNGINWTLTTSGLPTGFGGYSVATNGTRFVMLYRPPYGGGNLKFYQSTDGGQSWTDSGFSGNYLLSGAYWNGSISYNNGIWVMGSDSTDNKLRYSYDGLEWFNCDVSYTISNPASIQFQNGTWYITINDPTISVITSTNGINWTSTIIVPSFNSGGYISQSFLATGNFLYELSSIQLAPQVNDATKILLFSADCGNVANIAIKNSSITYSALLNNSSTSHIFYGGGRINGDNVAELMRIRGDGRVGINTSTLDYNLTVNSTMRTSYIDVDERLRLIDSVLTTFALSPFTNPQQYYAGPIFYNNTVQTGTIAIPSFAYASGTYTINWSASAAFSYYYMGIRLSIWRGSTELYAVNLYDDNFDLYVLGSGNFTTVVYPGETLLVKVGVYNIYYAFGYGTDFYFNCNGSNGNSPSTIVNTTNAITPSADGLNYNIPQATSSLSHLFTASTTTLMMIQGNGTVTIPKTLNVTRLNATTETLISAGELINPADPNNGELNSAAWPGASVTPIGNYHWVGTACSASGKYMAAVRSETGNSLYLSSNYGKTWNEIPLFNGIRKISMSASGQYIVIAYDATDQLGFSTNYGAGGDPVGPSKSWISVAISSDGKYVAGVADGDGVWLSADYAANWTKILNGSYTAVSMSANGRYIAACYNNPSSGTVQVSIDFGATFSAAITTGLTYGEWTNVAISASGKYMYLVGNNGQIWLSSSYGYAFDMAQGGVGESYLISCSGSGKYVVMQPYNYSGGGKPLYYSSDYGFNWTTIGQTIYGRTLAISGNGQYILVGGFPSELYLYKTPMMNGDLTMNTAGTDILNVSSINYQGSSVRLGPNSGLSSLANAVAIGTQAGQSNQSGEAIAIGNTAGRIQQGDSAIALGPGAGWSNQGQNGIAFGRYTGETNQGFGAVAIGQAAGNGDQGQESVAIGSSAATISQGSNAVAIGRTAGWNTQGVGSVAIGYDAGKTQQGSNAIAIGYQAGYTNQPANSIALNASSSALSPATAGLYVNPIRNVTTYSNVLVYDSTNKEIVFMNANLIAGSGTASTVSTYTILYANSMNTTALSTNYISTGTVAVHTANSRGVNITNTTSGTNPAEVYFDKTAAGATQNGAIGIGNSTRNFFINYNGVDRLTIAPGGSVIVPGGISTSAISTNTINAGAGSMSSLTISTIAINSAPLTITGLTSNAGTQALYIDTATNRITYGAISGGGGGATVSTYATVFAGSLSSQTISTNTITTSSIYFGLTSTIGSISAIPATGVIQMNNVSMISTLTATNVNQYTSSSNANISSITVGGAPYVVNQLGFHPTNNDIIYMVVRNGFNDKPQKLMRYTISTNSFVQLGADMNADNFIRMIVTIASGTPVIFMTYRIVPGTTTTYIGKCVDTGSPSIATVTLPSGLETGYGNIAYDTVSGHVYVQVSYDPTGTNGGRIYQFPVNTGGISLGSSISPRVAGDGFTSVFQGFGIAANGNRIVVGYGDFSNQRITYATVTTGTVGAFATFYISPSGWIQPARIAISTSGLIINAVVSDGTTTRLVRSTNGGSTTTDTSRIVSSATGCGDLMYSISNTYLFAAISTNPNSYYNLYYYSYDNGATWLLQITIDPNYASQNSGMISLSPNDSNLFWFNNGTNGVLRAAASFLLTNYTYTKTFVIDHPDNEDKYLVHACLEGPEAGVYYRGEATIEEGHTSISISLPKYVRNLATLFTVQISPIYNNDDSTQFIYRTSRVKDNKFTVYGPPGDFFWHVFGKRQSIEVEPIKSAVTVHGQGPYRWI